MNTPNILERLLAEDGFVLPTAGGSNKKILCPFHAEKTPSCNVNVTTGEFYCFGCGAGGNTLSYLLRYRNLRMPEAKAVLKEAGWHDEGLVRMVSSHERLAGRKKGRPPQFDKIPTRIRNAGGMDTHTKIAEHEYRLAEGKLICIRARYAPINEELGGKKHKKEIRPYTPRKEGGYWNADPKHTGIPPEDFLSAKYPLYRLPELLDTLKKHPEKQVWMPEGEKCVDAILKMPGIFAATTPIHHHVTDPEKMDVIDWEPLRDRKVLILADTDDKGRSNARKLASYLHNGFKCRVRMVLPKGEGGYDIADAIKEGGKEGAIKWIQEIVPEDYIELVAENPDASLSEGLPHPWVKTEHFQVLGILSNKQIAIQSFATHEPHIFSRKELQGEGTLITLAPLPWWKEQCPSGFTSSARLLIASHLIRAGEKMGLIELTDLHARGAIQHANDVYYNMGSHVLTDDGKGLLTKVNQFQDIEAKFLPGPTIKASPSKDGAAKAKALADCLLRYRFSSTNEARSFLGWIVTSLVGGALSFRPMLWLLGPKNVGKTYLLDHVLSPIMGNTLRRLADPSEAGIAQFVGSSSLPVYIDEFEPSVDNQTQYDRILALVRVATSGEAQRVRGGPSGELSSCTAIRFSLCVSSTQQKNLNSATASRFTVITFSREGIPDWMALKADIEQAASEANGAIIRHYIISHTKRVIAHAEQLEQALIKKYDTRTAKILAALTAGAALLSGDETPIEPTVAENKTDIFAPLEHILAFVLRIGEGSAVREIAVAEAIKEAYYDASGNPRPSYHVDHMLAEALGRHGIRLSKDASELRFAYSHLPLQKMLRFTPFANINLYQYFKNFPQAILDGTTRQRMRCGGYTKPFAAIPVTALDSMGFVPNWSDEELSLLEEKPNE